MDRTAAHIEISSSVYYHLAQFWCTTGN